MVFVIVRCFIFPSRSAPTGAAEGLLAFLPELRGLESVPCGPQNLNWKRRAFRTPARCHVASRVHGQPCEEAQSRTQSLGLQLTVTGSVGAACVFKSHRLTILSKLVLGGFYMLLDTLSSPFSKQTKNSQILIR